jgi:hypothetical protein
LRQESLENLSPDHLERKYLTVYYLNVAENMDNFTGGLLYIMGTSAKPV